jgi:hypothetical protein
MSLQFTNVIHKTKPVLIEGLILIAIGLIIVANTTMTDIKFHDYYVKPQISECYETNQSAFCQEIRQKMGLEKTAHLEIGNVYWNELLRQATMIGLIMLVVRLSFAVMLHKAGIRKIKTSSIMMAMMWGFVASGFFLFGFLDTFYFWFQGTDVSTLANDAGQLQWLDYAGVFNETKGLTGSPDHVEVMDLYLTNILGLVIVGGFWFLTMVAYAESGRSNKGIA